MKNGTDTLQKSVLELARKYYLASNRSGTNSSREMNDLCCHFSRSLRLTFGSHVSTDPHHLGKLNHWILPAGKIICKSLGWFIAVLVCCIVPLVLVKVFHPAIIMETIYTSFGLAITIAAGRTTFLYSRNRTYESIYTDMYSYKVIFLWIQSLELLELEPFINRDGEWELTQARVGFDKFKVTARGHLESIALYILFIQRNYGPEKEEACKRDTDWLWAKKLMNDVHSALFRINVCEEEFGSYFEGAKKKLAELGDKTHQIPRPNPPFIEWTGF